MKEYKVGEQIVLEVQETPIGRCEGCFFLDTPMFGDCYPMCDSIVRSDNREVIFVEKGK